MKMSVLVLDVEVKPKLADLVSISHYIKMEEILGAFKLIRVHHLYGKVMYYSFGKIQGCLSC